MYMNAQMRRKAHVLVNLVHILGYRVCVNEGWCKYMNAQILSLAHVLVNPVRILM